MSDYSNSTKNENLIMLMMAAGIIVFNFIGFIVVYFVWKEYSKESNFIKVNGARLLDFHISFFIYEVIAIILCVLIIGAFILPIIGLIQLVCSIIGMIKYGGHNDYEYPLSLKFIQNKY